MSSFITVIDCHVSSTDCVMTPLHASLVTKIILCYFITGFFREIDQHRQYFVLFMGSDWGCHMCVKLTFWFVIFFSLQKFPEFFPK